MDKEQRIKEFLNFNDNQSQLTKITSYFDDFQVKSNQHILNRLSPEIVMIF